MRLHNYAHTLSLDSELCQITLGDRSDALICSEPTTMDDTRTAYFRMLLRNRFLEAKRDAFQEFFVGLMQRAHSGDFVRTYSAGSHGDDNIDGYLKSDGTVFAVYAPDSIRKSEVEKKIREDFDGARRAQPGLLRRWIFVHNSDKGLHPDTLALLKLLTNETGIPTDEWGYEALWSIAKTISPSILEELLPASALDIQSSEPLSNYGDTAQATVTAQAQTIPCNHAARHRMLVEIIENQTLEISQHVDRELACLCDITIDDIYMMRAEDARAVSKKVEEYLHSRGEKISALVYGRAYILLADLAIVSAGTDDKDSGVDTSVARWRYAQARDAFGADISQDEAERLVRLSAKLDAIEGKYNEALDALKEDESPDGIRLRVALCIDSDNLDKGISLIANRPPHAKWCDFEIILWTRSGQYSKAQDIVTWSRQQCDKVFHRCALAFATSLASVPQDVREQLVAGHLPPMWTGLLRDAVEFLQPILKTSEITGKAGSKMQAEALAAAMPLLHWLGDRERVIRYAKVLSTWRPVSLAFVHAVQAGYAEAAESLPSLIREDHPSSFRASMLSASIEAKWLKRPLEAIEHLKCLAQAVKSTNQKQEVCELLLETAAAAGQNTQRDYEVFIEEQLGGDHPLVKARVAIRLIAEKSLTEARQVIESFRDEDSPIWWQLHSRLQYLEGRMSEAAKSLSKACMLLPSIDLHRLAAGLAQEAGRLDLFEIHLRALTMLDPTDEKALASYGGLLARQARFSEAVTVFRSLWKLRPDNATIGQNLAACLRDDGRAGEALEVLDQICKVKPAFLVGVLGRAHLLSELGKPDSAFQFLQQFRDEFWEDYRYLLAYVGHGFAAGQDRLAEQAFARLLELKAEGKVPEEQMRSVSIAEILEVCGRANQAHDSLDGEYLRGRVPWLVVDEALRRSPIFGWRLRTQECIVGDHPLMRARFAIYATNYFTIHREDSGEALLMPMECPGPNTEVIADLSAIITLHELGILDHAIRYFQRIAIPALLIPGLAEARSALSPYQPSRLRSCEQILDLFGRGAIQAMDDTAVPTSVPCLNEYEETGADGRQYRIIDVLMWLYGQGKLSETQFKSFGATCKPSTCDTPLASALSQGIVGDILTLRAIGEMGLLDVVTQNIRMFVRATDLEAVRAEAFYWKERDRLLERHDLLVRKVTDDKGFRRLASPKCGTGIDSNTHAMPLGLVALIHAEESDLPLLVDDRTCQVGRFNLRPQVNRAAFGTDALIVALLGAGLLTLEEASEAFLQLMRWRYRFLIPPVEILVHLSARNTSHPPASGLIEVSQYVHDCMRDPGLFGGLEQTTPPMSMAARYYQWWLNLIGEFLVRIWTVKALTEAAAEAITKWALSEFLPAPPLVLVPFYRQRLAECLPRHLLLSVLASDIALQNPESLDRGLVTIKETLGLTDASYIRIVGELTNV